MTKMHIRKLRKQKRRKQKKINSQLKKNLFGHLFIAPCCYCKTVFLVSDLTVEHIIPLCLEGTNDPANIALACQPCNHERGRQSWFQKREINKKYYEQYSSQYRKQDGQGTIQDPGTPAVYCEGEGI